MARTTQFPHKKLIGFDDEMLARIDDYRRTSDPIPNFSDAVRELVDAGLNAQPAPKSESRD
jgi:hypothetical protein